MIYLNFWSVLSVRLLLFADTGELFAESCIQDVFKRVIYLTIFMLELKSEVDYMYLNPNCYAGKRLIL